MRNFNFSIAGRKSESRMTLKIHNEGNKNNIALSPYGAASVIVALAEGLRGEACYEVFRAAKIPADVSTIRLGLRDIHRHLKSYFIPKEGFLAGLTLNRENVTLNPQYENILRYYGYDLESFNNPLYPDPFITTTEAVTREATTEVPASPVEPPPVTEPLSTNTPTEITPAQQSPTTEKVPRETAPQTSTAQSPQSTSEFFQTTPGIAVEEVTNGEATSTTQPPDELTVPDGTITTKRDISNTMNAVTTVAMDMTTMRATGLPVPAGSTTSESATTQQPDGQIVPEENLTTKRDVSKTTVVMDSTITSVITTDSTYSTNEMTESTTSSQVTEIVSDVIVLTSSDKSSETATASTNAINSSVGTIAPTLNLTNTSIAATSSLPTLTTTQKPVTLSTVVTSESAGSSLVIVDTTTFSTDNFTYSVTDTTTEENVTEDVSTITTETNLNITTEEEDSTSETVSTTNMEIKDFTTETTQDFTTEQVMTSTTNIPTTTNLRVVPMSKLIRAIKFKEKSRKIRSIIDYIIARQLDKYYNPSDVSYHRKSTYIPQRQLTFLVDGKYIEGNIKFMTYDTVLPFHYIPSLRASALSFPLDSTQYYLLLILPDRPDGVDDLICELKRASDLKYIIRNLKYRRVQAVIPSFMLRGYVNLTPTLQKMGIQKIFEPRQADFSAMTNAADLYVTNIEQAITVTIRNYVDLGLMRYHGDYLDYGPAEFKADHPFLYFVMDSELHVALMAGKVLNPLNSRIR